MTGVSRRACRVRGQAAARGMEPETNSGSRITAALAAALARARAGKVPGRLASAVEYAVMPGGARVRPRLCLAVARASGGDRRDLSDAAAAAIELIHCASLVHDDLPCFDDAELRRGKASLHRVYGQAIAVLAGDALITMAFEVLAHNAEGDPVGSARMILELARAAGMPAGLCAGQAWESESTVDLATYHRAKTGSLFIAATRMGAMAAGADPMPWGRFGEHIGAAFQIADDLRDALGDETAMGKPGGQDRLRDRPNAVASYGVAGATRRFEGIIDAATTSIPPCPGKADLCEIVRQQAKLLLP